MGKLDQLAKDVFAEETPLVTHGAAVCLPAAELGLCEVRLDGVLRVHVPAELATLPAPWCLASRADEVVLENKMQGDHLGMPALDRAVLRRQARQVQRVEDAEAPWEGEEPLWITAPNVPAVLRERRSLHREAPGCYRVEPYPFSLVWIAANELPLDEALIPFLIARSGRALDAFCHWVKTRRPPTWLTRVVRSLPMSTATEDELLSFIEKYGDDPEILARSRRVTKKMVNADPVLREEIVAEVRDEGRNEGRLVEARKALRQVLTARALPLGAEEEARIDACTDPAALERWLGQAAVATTTAQALR